MKSFLLFIPFFFILSCSEPTNPPDNGPDTTSHNFSWQMYNFGGQTGSSVLRDVAIIDENNIWAVGEIFTEDTYTYDSLGNWIDPYNAIHWNGKKWELERILYNGNYWQINTLYAFDENNISFEFAVLWNGTEFIDQPIPELITGKNIKKIWGLSSDNLYVVALNGFIAHYNGQNWQKIESGTNLNINDIYGAENPETGELEIYCVASNHLSDPQFRREILKINSDHSVTKLNTEPINWTLYSLWFYPGGKYFVAGDGIYKKNNIADSLWMNQVIKGTQYYTYRIRGNAENDVVAVGGSGEVLHYNGKSWKSFLSVTDLSWGNYYSVDIYKDLVVVVGIDNPRAIIAFGIRNN